MKRIAPYLAAACLAMTAISGFPIRNATGEDRPNKLTSITLRDIPHVRQKPDFCGEACAEMFLRKLGRSIDQDFVFDRSGLDPLQGRGCYTRELHTALTRIGFQTGSTWYTVAASRAEPQMNWMFEQLHGDLKAGFPSIVCMRYDSRPNTTEHFRLIVGYDADKDEVLYHEPAVERGAYRRMKRESFLKLWPLKYETDQWTVIRFRLRPGQLIAGSASSELTDADFAQHIRKLKRELSDLKDQQTELKKQREIAMAEEKASLKREAERRKALIDTAKEKARKAEEKAKATGKPIPEDEKVKIPKFDRPLVPKLKPRIVSDFHVVIQRPFVVIGDESPDVVKRHAQGVIAWAVRHIKSDYFKKDPDHVINIWLFRDKVSYQQNLNDIFDRQPHTPFGYYSPSEKALVMDISTGGGTLVHEIVHPFMAANFPDCPSWFNEGLASLYEQCNERNGRIWGLTNWRLRGLQKAIENEDFELPKFEDLCGTTRREFYNYDRGTNYAQARYLCYYLQDKGLLVKYFHEFRKSAKDDPTGFKTLQRILDVENDEDMEEFQEEWTEFVLKLRF